MTRDEYLHMLGTEPATSTQVGAIIGEFERLGVADRAERLAICAELLGLEELGSTSGLVMGQAGYLVNLLQRTRDRAELAAVTAAAVGDGQDDEHGDGQDGNEPITWPEAIVRIIAMLYTALQPESDTAERNRPISAAILRDRREGGFLAPMRLSAECKRGQSSKLQAKFSRLDAPGVVQKTGVRLIRREIPRTRARWSG